MSKYETNVKDRLDDIVRWYGEGWRVHDICRELDISVTLMYKYRRKYPELEEAIKEGKSALVEVLEGYLLELCKGHEIKEEHIERDFRGREKVKSVTKEVAPNLQALNLYLHTLNPERFNNDKKVKVSLVDELTEEEIDNKIKELLEDGPKS